MSLIKEYLNFVRNTNFLPAKKLGQTFLIDKNILEKILAIIRKLDVQKLLEVGPGLGFLTTQLLKLEKPMSIVEFDKRLFEYLNHKYKEEKIKIVSADILNIEKIEKNTSMISNLPYTISGPFLWYLIEKHEFVSNGALLLQKDFVDKICSEPCHKIYNALTVIFNYFFKPIKTFAVSKNVFVPKPKVDSKFIAFEKKAKREFKSDSKRENEFILFVKKCFVYKRKTLLNNWIDEKTNWEKIKEIIDNKSIRAEQITLEQFIEIFRKINN